MRAILPLFASLMLMLTAWTVAAHAAERPVMAGVASTADHGDPAGEDHALVHQHGGCHGHFLDVARAPAFAEGHAPAARVVAAQRGAPLASRASPPHLRPPQA